MRIATTRPRESLSPLARRPRLWPRFGWTLIVLHLAGPTAADPANDAIRDLLQTGKPQTALIAAEKALDARPQDPELRLLRANALEAMGDPKAAVRVLETLIREYPAAPGPYNDLARLYARQGRLDQARETLERGLAGHPVYATLHRNLTGVYEAQAQAEYAKALDLNGATPKPDLNPLLALHAPESPQPARAPPTPPKAKPSPKTADPEPTRAQETQPPAPDPVQALTAWAKAWSAKDIAGYLAAYDADFHAPGGDRATWAQKRRQRLRKPQWIQVRLDQIQVTPRTDDAVTITALQRYRSNTFQSTVRKRWRLRLDNGVWRIVAERVLR